MARKSTVMRVQDNTLKALRIYAGELMMETGEVYSDNDTLWQIMTTIRPDIIKKVEKMDKEEDK